VVGHALPYRIAPRRAGDPAEVVADARRIGTLLKWTPRFTALKRIMETSIAWERSIA
jgi:UDP-glucose 4-epimerase